MTLATRIQSLWRAVVGSEDAASTASFVSVEADTGELQLSGFDIAPNDPIVGPTSFRSTTWSRSRLWTSIHLPCGL